MKNDNRSTKKKLKIIIFILISLTFGVLVVPFTKYFLLATHQEQLEVKELKTVPDIIPTSENINSLEYKDIIKYSAKQSVDSLGTVVIPEINVVQPILLGLTNQNMVHGVVSLFPEREPNNSSFTLIGHNVRYNNWGNSLLFGGIHKLTEGSEVFISYLGKTYEYQVESNIRIDEKEVNRLSDRGAEYLLMVTCDSAIQTSNRTLVIAKKIRETPEKFSFRNTSEEVQYSRKKQYKKIFLIPLLILCVSYFVSTIWLWRQ